MRKRAIVVGLSLTIFFASIILVGVSSVSKKALVQYKQTLEGPLRGNEIADMAIYLPYAGRCGINLTGSFQGYEEQPIFIIKDYEGLLIYSSPYFPAPSNVIEFDIEKPGFYSIDFNIIVSDDSRYELYQYRYRIEDVRPYAHLYYVGIPLAILGIVGVTAGLFMSFKGNAAGNKGSCKTMHVCSVCGLKSLPVFPS